MVSYLGFLGPAWPPVRLLGLFALVWNPGDEVQSGLWVDFKEYYLAVGGVYLRLLDSSSLLVKPKASSKMDIGYKIRDNYAIIHRPERLCNKEGSWGDVPISLGRGN